MTTPAGERPVLPVMSFPDDHIRKQMAMDVEHGDELVTGRFLVRPSMWGTGSTRPRLSLFALAMDNLSGHLPSPVHFPTVDLRAQFLDEPPSGGIAEIHGRTLRVGRRVVVSEFEYRDEAGRPFGRGMTTMSNNPHDGWQPDDQIEPTHPIPSFEALLGARIIDERTLELDPNPQISNGAVQTPHGGAQTLFAELAAEHLAGRPCAAVDVDVHFLRAAKVGPVRATATHAGTTGAAATYRIDLTDVGAGGALVAAVTVLSLPVPPA